jgi:hypothetical protein
MKVRAVNEGSEGTDYEAEGKFIFLFLYEEGEMEQLHVVYFGAEWRRVREGKRGDREVLGGVCCRPLFQINSSKHIFLFFFLCRQELGA